MPSKARLLSSLSAELQYPLPMSMSDSVLGKTHLSYCADESNYTHLRSGFGCHPLRRCSGKCVAALPRSPSFCQRCVRDHIANLSGFKVIGCTLCLHTVCTVLRAELAALLEGRSAVPPWLEIVAASMPHASEIQPVINFADWHIE